MAQISIDLGVDGDLADQVIEGTPGRGFFGRLTLTVTAQDRAKVTA